MDSSETLKFPPLNEALLLTLLQPSAGFRSPRSRLDKTVEDEILGIITHKFPEEETSSFRIFLRHIFTHAVEGETLSQSSRQREPQAAKLSTITRQKLKEYCCRYKALAGRTIDDPEVDAFLRDIKGEQIIAQILEFWWENQLDQDFLSFEHSADRERAFTLLGQALADLHIYLEPVIKPGRSEPAMEQMARGLAELYLNCTGEFPKRNWDNRIDKDTGPFIEICSIMARAINEALPIELKRDTPVKMAKIARRMMKELKLEKAAAEKNA